MARVETVYRYTHAASGTFFDAAVIGSGADAGDKAFLKAMTSALKYALRQPFLIETGDDPDDTSSEELAADNLPEKFFANLGAELGNQFPNILDAEKQSLMEKVVFYHMQGHEPDHAVSLAIEDYNVYLKGKQQ